MQLNTLLLITICALILFYFRFNLLDRLCTIIFNVLTKYLYDVLFLAHFILLLLGYSFHLNFIIVNHSRFTLIKNYKQKNTNC